jgi:hypothetical protein
MARLLVLAADYAGDPPVLGEAGPYAELTGDDVDGGWTGVCAACRWRTDQETARQLDLDGAFNSAAIHVDTQCPTREES